MATYVIVMQAIIKQLLEDTIINDYIPLGHYDYMYMYNDGGDGFRLYKGVKSACLIISKKI